MKHTGAQRHAPRRDAASGVRTPDRACPDPCQPSRDTHVRLISLSRSAKKPKTFLAGSGEDALDDHAIEPKWGLFSGVLTIVACQWSFPAWNMNHFFLSTKNSKEATHTVKSLAASSRLCMHDFRSPVPRIILAGVELPSFVPSLQKELFCQSCHSTSSLN
jgi:hypothetical protein